VATVGRRLIIASCYWSFYSFKMSLGKSLVLTSLEGRRASSRLLQEKVDAIGLEETKHL
jgi:hypothetical protein